MDSPLDVRERETSSLEKLDPEKASVKDVRIDSLVVVDYVYTARPDRRGSGLR